MNSPVHRKPALKASFSSTSLPEASVMTTVQAMGVPVTASVTVPCKVAICAPAARVARIRSDFVIIGLHFTLPECSTA